MSVWQVQHYAGCKQAYSQHGFFVASRFDETFLLCVLMLHKKILLKCNLNWFRFAGTSSYPISCTDDSTFVASFKLKHNASFGFVFLCIFMCHFIVFCCLEFVLFNESIGGGRNSSTPVQRYSLLSGKVSNVCTHCSSYKFAAAPRFCFNIREVNNIIHIFSI